MASPGESGVQDNSKTFDVPISGQPKRYFEHCKSLENMTNVQILNPKERAGALVVVAVSYDVPEEKSVDEFGQSNLPSSSRYLEKKNKILRYQPLRGSMKTEHSTVKIRWRRIRKTLGSIKPQYEGRYRIGVIILFLMFLQTATNVWWTSFGVSTRAMRKVVIVCIGFMILLGLMFTFAGLFKMSRFEPHDLSQDFYWAITFVALVVLTLAVLGSVGIFRPNILVTEIFATTSFVFGHFIFAIVLSWYLLVSLDQYLSGTYFSGYDSKRTRKIVDETQIYNDEFLQTYFKLLIVISLIMMTAGVITTKLLIQIRRKQGYITVFSGEYAEYFHGMPK